MKFQEDKNIELLRVPVWGMRVGINSLPSSISALSTDLKRIQTPHSLFRGFRAENSNKTPQNTITTRLSDSRVQVTVPAGHLANHYSRRQSKGLTAKTMAKLLGLRPGTA